MRSNKSFNVYYKCKNMPFVKYNQTISSYNSKKFYFMEFFLRNLKKYLYQLESQFTKCFKINLQKSTILNFPYIFAIYFLQIYTNLHLEVDSFSL